MANEKLKADRLWSLESEAGLLGSMIIGPECIPEIIPVIINEEAFYKSEHRQIYQALINLHLSKVSIDAVTLRSELKKAGQLERVGGVKYLAKLMRSVPHSANAKFYAGIIRDRQKYRQLVNCSHEIMRVINEPFSLEEQIQQVRDLVLEIEPDSKENEYFDVANHTTRIAGEMQNREDVIETGFRNIDKIIEGISPGELIIIAGRPSMGKTALALDFALKMAQAGKSIVYFSLEMTHRALIERACCNLGHVDMTVIKGGNPTKEDLEKLYAAAFEIQKLPIVLHESGTTPEKQIAFVQVQKKVRGVDVVVVDYLQLMNTSRKTENRQQEITAISSRLKRFAMSEHIPVIALSQLNRAVEAREKHRPRLSDLRESGSLEQDADVVMLLHREDYYRRSEKPNNYERDGIAEVIIAKNKRGPVGIAEMAFLEEYVKFGDLRKNIREDSETGDERLFAETRR